ncbi:chemotaxis protein CheW [uncultured Oceanisphaera sp.]|uniref:chemotaxis protein CheW n=1 Tax=uncultured Oceanisphaera sp. TaxID=353858 RepID=UPI002606E22C|nr:chemotaxis protein CheW [uncultured Oceanisphaera sp.]
MNQRHTDALDDYFGALLEESPSREEPEWQQAPSPAPAEAPLVFADPAEEERRLGLEALLARVAELKEEESLPPAETIVSEPEPTAPVAPEPAIMTEARVEPTPAIPEPTIPEPTMVEPTPVAAVEPEPVPVAAATPAAAEWRNMDTESSFQALFFEVAGMTFAVPLTHLGGIYQMTKLTSLFGKPNWFAGVLTERERQLYVVDTARWAMPGHQAQEQYQYLVTLGESNWGLGCHQLKGTALLTRDQVKWRATPGSRPWLAGMVKEKMCALLHVDALIGLLEQGKNIDGQQV